MEILNTNKIYFQDNIGEGQFYAILKKKEQFHIQAPLIDFATTNARIITINKKNSQYSLLLKSKQKIYNIFIKVFNEYIDYDISNDKSIELILLNNKIYAVPPNIPLNMIDSLNILRIGMELAEIKNNTISLSHAISHSKYTKNFKHSIELNYDDSIKYLKGESFNVDSEIKSFAIATYKSIPLGLCKIINHILKNHYPKGLRNLN